VKIELTEVRRIARLAQLEYDDAELPLLAGQLSEILTYMESLARLDTRLVEPTFHSLEHAGPLREDLPAPGLGAEEATRGAPGGEPGKFLVPRIIG
jgi:aspartyl-tRNA(Asn)/glutamyl-tRNA(Gln) amidotransferase subunit C